MLNEINSYRKEHKTFKILFLIGIMGMSAVVGISVYYNYRLIQKFTNTTWIAVDGKAYKAELKQGFQYKDRIYERILAAKMFYKSRYAADRYNQESNIREALELCGNCSENVLIGYDDEGMQQNIKEKGWVYQCQIDSVLMEDDYTGYVFGKQIIITKTKELKRNMYIRFKSKDLNSRADKNPLAIVLDEVDCFNNKVLDY